MSPRSLSSIAVLVAALAMTPTVTAAGPEGHVSGSRPVTSTEQGPGRRPATSTEQGSGRGPATASEQFLKEGDRAALAGEGTTALARYRMILAEDPRNALVHYRVGQVQAIKGELNEAEQAYFAALRFSGTDDALRAKVLFCIADLRERQSAYDAAVDAWTEYEKQAVKAPSAAPHVRIAAERKTRVAEWKRALAAAADTKARVERRARE